VAHTCNPSYLGGGHEEDHSLRPAQAKSLWDSHLTNIWAWWCTLSSQVHGRLRSGGLRFEASLGREFAKTSPPKEKNWARWYTPVTPATVGNVNRRFVFQSRPGRKARPYLKNNQSKKGWRCCSQEVECLLSNHKTLCSNHRTAKKETDKQIRSSVKISPWFVVGFFFFFVSWFDSGETWLSLFQH
jgi:hypothetical protein